MLFALLLAAAPAPLTTVAEQSHYTRTGRYDEVETLCAELPKRYPGKLKCEPFGVTPLGRTMRVFIASLDGTFTPEALKKKQRPVVLYQGGIHAGEIDGKDAGLWLLKDLLDGKAGDKLLAKVTLVFVPVFNVDGHERVSKNNRPNQVGPEEMGWRVTSQNLNLNRDYAKAETPEMQAMLGLLGRYDPILYADLHVTDGAKFQPDVAVLLEPRHSGPEALRAIGQIVSTSAFEELKTKGHQPLDFYPSFQKDDDPASGFSYGVPPPRLSNGYWNLKNRFVVLVETHSWKPYLERVKATYDVCLALLSRAAEQGPRWLEVAHAADAADEQAAGKPVPLLWDNTEHKATLDFPGYAYTREDSQVSGAKWVRYDDSKPEVWKVPFFDELKPAVTLNAPKGGYLVPPPHAEWVKKKLELHGFRSTLLDKPKGAVTVESFRVVDAKFKPTPYEGRQTVQVKGEWKADQRDLPRGTLYVPAGQRGVALLMNLLEPLGPDSLMSWGYFNAHLEQKEYMEPYVTEAVAREMLKDPQVKAAFEARLKADPGFAKSPDERLRFFYLRHESFDERYNLYPVYRVDAAP
ncbi:MAG: peptidase M14 [Archangiaceae bacterium]|nr:peptidase M14 [Archangiaceae bacterium]